MEAKKEELFTSCQTAWRNKLETGFRFQWHITDICDQRCRHCYVFAENGEKTPVSMNFDQMREVIARCDDFTAGLGMHPLFAITGGDPVLCPDFWRLTELLKERGDPFVMMGNPFHLDEEACKRLRDCGCYQFQVSLDGMEKTHTAEAGYVRTLAYVQWETGSA